MEVRSELATWGKGLASAGGGEGRDESAIVGLVGKEGGVRRGGVRREEKRKGEAWRQDGVMSGT